MKTWIEACRDIANNYDGDPINPETVYALADDCRSAIKALDPMSDAFSDDPIGDARERDFQALSFAIGHVLRSPRVIG